MPPAPHLPLTGFYQFGYTTANLEHAQEELGRRYGLTRWRVRQPNPSMRTAHAYAGDSQLELIEPSADGEALYLDHMPGPGGIVRLHHLGYRIDDAAGWRQLEEAIAARGLATPKMGVAMGGDLHYAYIDTRAELGIWTEYVWRRGSAANLYDDVPRH